MSCYNNCYLPNPPRAWSRVQNSCSLVTDQNVNSLLVASRIAMLEKGNVLQYKANSANLTKAQRYSQIAQGRWVNRNTTWATQSTRGFTNPNTTSLKRGGNVQNIAIDPATGLILGTTNDPVSCPEVPPVIINEGLPGNQSSGPDDDQPVDPPPIEPSESSNTFPSIIPEPIIEPIVIQDGGSLICSVQENICTGETKQSLSQQLCHPTSDSDVPGPIIELCWNDGTQTWYPRQRYTMSNSTDKWPVNARLASAVTPTPPDIYSYTYDNATSSVQLLWRQNVICLPTIRFDIYQNQFLIKSVSGTTYSSNITVSSPGNYSYYIVSVSSTNIQSVPSNIVNVSI